MYCRLWVASCTSCVSLVSHLGRALWPFRMEISLSLITQNTRRLYLRVLLIRLIFSSVIQNLHKLIRYLLTPGAAERPDVFQAAHLAFQLKSKKSPIQNLHHLPSPTFSTLSTTAGQTQPPAVDTKPATLQPNTPNKAPSAAPHSPAHTNPPTQFGTPSVVPLETTTSVNPRSRPKGTSALKGPLPLPFQANSLSGKKGSDPPKLEAPPVKAAVLPVSNPFPVSDHAPQPNGPTYSSSNPFTSDAFQDPGPTSLSCSSGAPGGPNPPSGPASLCSFPSEPGESSSTAPFSQGHRRIVSETQAFQRYHY